MNRVYLLIAGVMTLGVYFVVAPAALTVYRRYRGRRTIICPETDQISEINIKAARAGIMAALGRPSLRVKWCSLWPRRKGCAQRCLKDDWPAAAADDRSRRSKNHRERIWRVAARLTAERALRR